MFQFGVQVSFSYAATSSDDGHGKCQLPPQAHKLKSGDTRQLPGKIVLVSRAECAVRAGTYFSLLDKGEGKRRGGKTRPESSDSQK